MRSAADSRLARHLGLDWSALFGGSLIGWGAMLLLSMIGMILGISVLDVFGARPAISNSGAAIFGACCAIVCGALGAFCVVRLAGDRRRTESLMHGAVSWGMSMLLAGMIALWASSASAFSRTPARNTALTPHTRGSTVALVETSGNGDLVALIACAGALLALGGSLLGALAAASRESGIPIGRELTFHRQPDGRRVVTESEVRRDETTIIPPTH
ncbi:MAG TPA: hypothetical protein VLW85_19540 [Myxococcales bacterium]|nr:hypothetical protein [Myxococcales bacterium]